MGLDLLRFGAAALVMSFHLACTSWSDPRSEAAGLMAGAVRYPEFLSLSRNGWVGVPIFFVISGFVIAFSAEQSTARRFLKSRILRLMPGIWICATVSFLLALSFAPDSGLVSTERYLRTLVVVPIPRWIDGVYWTLSIEMSFYALVWALLLRHQLRRLETIMIAIGLCSAVIWGLADSAWIPGLDILANKRIAQLLLVTHGCDFALGVLIWRLSKDGVTAWRLSAGLVCLVGAVFQIMVDERSVFRDLKLGAPDALASEIFLIFVGLFALAIWGNRAFLRFLPPRALSVIRLMGLATYPLYLLHTFVGVLAIRLAVALGLAAVPALGFGMGIAILAALLVTRFAEPALRHRLADGLERLEISFRRVPAASASEVASRIVGPMPLEARNAAGRRD